MSSALPFAQLVYESRSVRRFRSVPIDRDALLEIVEQALLTPSAGNRQLVRYVLVPHRDKRRGGVFDTLRWAGYYNGAQSDEGVDGRHWPLWNGPNMRERPSGYIVLLLPEKADNWAYTDLGIVAQTLALAARYGNGYASCIIGAFDKPALTAALFPKGLPDNIAGYQPALVLAFGLAGEKPEVEELPDSGDVRYWRDDEGRHHVPKLSEEQAVVG